MFEINGNKKEKYEKLSVLYFKISTILLLIFMFSVFFITIDIAFIILILYIISILIAGIYKYYVEKINIYG